MEIKKNSVHTVEFTDISKNGEGIGKTNGFTVFVSGAIEGDTAEVRIIKVKKNYGYGKLLNIIKPSPYRVTPPCPYFPKCGGCSLLNTDYARQLEIKRNIVKSNLKRIGGIDFDVPLPIAAAENFRYRNKAQMPIGKNKNGEPLIGFYSRYSHRIIDIDDCIIQNDNVGKITQMIKEYIKETSVSVYDEESHKGILRYVLIRTAQVTGEISAMFVINADELPFSDILINKLKNIPDLSGITVNINRERTNAVIGKKLKTLWGKSTIVDRIGGLEFEISPTSFFQVNPRQTQILYNTALDFANIKKNYDIVFDAYCGTGTISLFLAQKAKKVYGIEIVADAVENARKNALRNNIFNAEFIEGKSETEIPRLYAEGIKADVVVTDPPRKGCGQNLLDVLAKMQPSKIVYISCDPATLARDLKYLTQKGYTLQKVQPVDMFCHSVHIETVCLLEK